MESVTEFLAVHDPPGPLGKQGIAKILSLISATKTDQELIKLTEMLLLLSKSEPIVNQLVSANDRVLSATLDRMLCYALNESRDTIVSQEMIIVVFDMIGVSDKLKSRLGFTIHEYVLSALEKGKLGSELVSKSMELLVSAVTHHPENRTKFVKNTSKERIKRVFDFLFETGNPMAEIFAVEFLWRVAVPMRLSANDKQKIFGPMAEDLYSITAESFRDGILKFVHKVNDSRKDDNRVLQFQVTNLMIGNISSDGEHTAYAGADTILFWVTKSAFQDIKPDIELVSINKNEIDGIGVCEGKWVLRMTETFDTLPTFFEEASKMIVFTPLCDDKECILGCIQNRFNSIEVNELPKARQETSSKKKNTGTTIAQTPKLQPKTPKHCPKTKASTPRVSVKNPNTSKVMEQKQDIPPQTPTVARLPPKRKVQTINLSSSDSESDGFFMPPDLSKPKTDQKMNTNRDKIRIGEDTMLKEDRLEGLPKQPSSDGSTLKPKSMFQRTPTQKNQPQTNLPASPRKADVKEKVVRRSDNVEKDVDDLPTMSISQSYQCDSDEESGNPTEDEAPKKQTSVSAPKPVFEKKVYPAQRREYTPEKWEMETFDELKAFGSAIREKLQERKTMLIRSVEDSVLASCKEITSYMEKCDSGLDQLRNDFMTQSVQFSKDITQKQKMVEELGLQQTEHIDQMMKDCDVIQKRAEEQMKRLNNQVKNMLANQEKHIALFREDMRSEFRAVVTSRKRESSKRIVQQLVTLLDEL